MVADIFAVIIIYLFLCLMAFLVIGHYNRMGIRRLEKLMVQPFS